MAVPTITIGTPSRTKISSITGYDQATVTFQSDIALQSWEARATTEGQETGHGIGLLVESGGSLEANTDATVYVDDEELTSGDVEYTITVFGHGTDGYWSDGTYEAINLLDYNDASIGSGTTVSKDGYITFDTGSVNTDPDSTMIFLETWTTEWESDLYRSYSIEEASVAFTKDSSFSIIRVGFYGNVDYTSVYFNVDYLEDGNYVLKYNIESLGLNHAELSNLMIVKAVV